jgi:hypothetical protein
MQTLKDFMTTCVILHNMIIEGDRGLNLSFFFDNVGTRDNPARNMNTIAVFFETYHEIENAPAAKHLQLDLIEHHWRRNDN